MKIEKINDNQIRCTLTQEDLDEHEVMLTELALGTDNAKELFSDLMEQAYDEFGFEVEDNPLMIEAVPISKEKIVLVITKVDDEDSLSDRLSNFVPPTEDLSDEDKDAMIDRIFEDLENGLDEDDGFIAEYERTHPSDNNDDIVDAEVVEESSTEIPITSNDADSTDDKGTFSPISELLREMKKAMEKKVREQAEKNSASADSGASNKTGASDRSSTSGKKAASSKPKSKPEKPVLPENHRIYRFTNLMQVICVAEILSGYYKGENTLYKDAEEDYFYLLIERNPHTEEEFREIGDTLGEFAMQIQYSYAIKAYCEEHFVKIAEGNAIDTLAEL